MPSAVGYGGYAPRNPSGHLSRLLAGIHADPLLLLLERLHHVPRNPRSAALPYPARYASKAIGRANGTEVWAQ